MQLRTSYLCGHGHDPNLTMSLRTFAAPPLPPSTPPLPPLNANTHAGILLALALSNLISLQNANIDNLVNKCFAMLPEMDALGDGKILGERGTADQTNSSPLFLMGLSTTSLLAEVDSTAKGTVSEGTEGGSIFPSAVPTLQNCFHNQNSELNNKGYDSKGGLPFFAGEPDNNGDAYIKPLLDNGSLAAPPSPPEPAATALLMVESVMRLNVTQLKDELRKRGRSCVGRKSDLQDHLKETILTASLFPLAMSPLARSAWQGWTSWQGGSS
jgi:hypothetical protein